MQNLISSFKNISYTPISIQNLKVYMVFILWKSNRSLNEITNFEFTYMWIHKKYIITIELN